MADVKETIKNKLLKAIKDSVGKGTDDEIYGKIQHYKEFVLALDIESDILSRFGGKKNEQIGSVAVK